MARIDGLQNCEDDEADHLFRAAQQLTTEQLRRAGEIVNAALPNNPGGVPLAAAVAVLQAFATNFSALAISRGLPAQDD